MQSLDSIVRRMPDTIAHQDLHVSVNRTLGIGDRVPQSWETYSISEIMRCIRDQGYVPCWVMVNGKRDHVNSEDSTCWTKVPEAQWPANYRRRD